MHPASREQALDAIRQFHAEHGRLPRRHEWEAATPTRPYARTIERRWGWRELLAAVGTRPNAHFGELSWEAVLDDCARALPASRSAGRVDRRLGMAEPGCAHSQVALFGQAGSQLR